MNQQEETEKGKQKLGKQKTEIEGGKAGGGQGTEKANIRACLIQAMADLFSVISVASCLIPNTCERSKMRTCRITIAKDPLEW